MDIPKEIKELVKTGAIPKGQILPDALVERMITEKKTLKQVVADQPLQTDIYPMHKKAYNHGRAVGINYERERICKELAKALKKVFPTFIEDAARDLIIKKLTS